LGYTSLNARTLQLYGSVIEQGNPKPETEVYINYFGKDTTTITDKLGYYHLVIDVPFSSGQIRISALNCIGDTVTNRPFYSSGQNLLVSHFDMCSQVFQTYLLGNVYYKRIKAPRVKVEFSLNEFKTVLEFVTTDAAGHFETPMIVGPRQSGIMWARVRDCTGKFIYSHVDFNAGDTLSFTFSKCKDPDYTLLTGQLQGKHRKLFSHEMKLFLYEFDREKRNLILSDSTYLGAGGNYEMFISDYEYYLLKLIPESERSPYIPAYLDGSLLWDKEEVLAVKSLEGMIRRNVIVDESMKSTGHATIKGFIHEMPGYSLSLHNHPVLLFDEEFKPINFDLLKGLNEYEFNNLQAGTYYVWIDDPGKPSVPVKVEVSNLSSLYEATPMVVNEYGIGPEGVLQTEETDLQNAINLYPNPFVNFIRFSLEEGEEMQVKVMNMSGSVLIEQNASNSSQINTSNLPSGNYLIQYRSDDQMFMKRMVKP
jgi:hypothetical protein